MDETQKARTFPPDATCLACGRPMSRFSFGGDNRVCDRPDCRKPTREEMVEELLGASRRDIEKENDAIIQEQWECLRDNNRLARIEKAVALFHQAARCMSPEQIQESEDNIETFIRTQL